MAINIFPIPTREVDVTALLDAVVQAESDRAATEGFRDEAEAFSSAAGTGANFYTTIALGRAAVADGATFGVEAGGSDGLTRATLYRRDSSSTQTLIVPLVNGTEYDNTADDAGIHARARASAIADGITDNEQLNAIVTAGGYFNFQRGDNLLEGVTKASINSFSALTKTRASTALALTTAGVYSSFAANILRVTNRGALIEAAATQILTQPVDFSNAAWAKGTGISATTVTSVAAGAPDGTTAAYDLTENSTGATNAATVSATNASMAAGNYCFSVHMKRGANRYAMLLVTSNASIYAAVVDFDATSPTIVQASGAIPAVAVGIEILGGGYVRAFLSFTHVSGNIVPAVRGCDGVTYASRTYSTTSGNVYARAAMAQLETGLAPTSPILTGSATRAADAVSLAWTDTGNSADTISIAYSGGPANFARSALASPGTINLVTDGGGAWLGKYITAISLRPAQATTYRTTTQKIDDRAAGMTAGRLVSLRADLDLVKRAAGLGGSIGVGPAALSPLAATLNGCAPYLSKGSVFYWNGQIYGTEAAMIAAAGGTLTSGRVLLDDYTTGENLIAGTDWDDTTAVGGGTITASGAEWQLDTTGTGTVGRQFIFEGLAGKGLKFTLKARRGTAGSSTVFLSGGQFANGSSPGGAAAITSTSQVALSVYFDTHAGINWYVAVTQGGGARGTVFLQDPALYECWPAEGFPQANWTIKLDGWAAPATLPGSTQVIAEWAAGTLRDFIRLELTSAGDIVLRRSLNAGTGASESIVTLTLGTVTGGQSFNLAAFMSHNQMGGAVNGSGVQTDFNGTMGSTHWRLATSSAGEAFTGTIGNYTLYDGTETLSWCKAVTATQQNLLQRRRLRRLVANGDSYSINGSTGIGMSLSNLAYDIINIGVGGTTFATQAATGAARTDLFHLPQIWWDGSPNGHSTGSITAEQALIVAWIANMGHDNWLYVRSGQIYTLGAADYNDMTDLYNWVSYTYGAAHVYDPQPTTIALAIQDPANAGYANDIADLAAGRFPRSTLFDTVHLTTAARRAIAKNMAGAIDTILAL